MSTEAPTKRPGKPRPPRHTAATRPNQVRLIGGQWKRSKLPVANRPGLRPTPDRVRETLFNWLGHDLAGWRVLDAFAGSGALGFEAASRGAVDVVMLEQDPVLVTSLKATATRLGATGLRVERADALSWMARGEPARWDVVFLDPPFDAGVTQMALAAASRIVAPGGFVYLESPAVLVDLPPGLAAHRSLQAGAVHAQLLIRQV